MLDIQFYEAIDGVLEKSAKIVLPLYYIEPVNREQQKEEFLLTKSENPSFKYRELEYDPKEMEHELGLIEIPSGSFGKIFQKKKRNILLENRVIENRGDENIVREATTIIHGIPDKKLVAYADELLRKIPNTEFTKTVSSDIIKGSLEDTLVKNGLTDWKVEFSDKKLTIVYPTLKKITISENRKFANMDAERLAVHEVGVHILRSANGYLQPLKIFGFGLPGYLPTEEGLTSYFEEYTGNTNEEIKRDHAGRVIAVDSVCNQLDFRRTFDRLKNYGFTIDQSWNLAVRAHRGGGYIKDHVYLDGYLKVKEYANANGDFRILYVGKVGLGDLPLVRELLMKGILKQPKYIPEFIKS